MYMYSYNNYLEFSFNKCGENGNILEAAEPSKYYRRISSINTGR